MAHPNLGLLIVHLKNVLRAKPHDAGWVVTSWDCERLTYVYLLRALRWDYDV